MDFHLHDESIKIKGEPQAQPSPKNVKQHLHKGLYVTTSVCVCECVCECGYESVCVMRVCGPGCAPKNGQTVHFYLAKKMFWYTLWLLDSNGVYCVAFSPLQAWIKIYIIL